MRARPRTTRLVPFGALAVLLLLLLTACGDVQEYLDRLDIAGGSQAPPPNGIALATVETEPVPHHGDAADDPAIWLHPTDPASSTVIATDKEGGIAVYDLAGRQLHYLEATAPNNVALRAGFPLGGERVDLVAVSEKAADEILFYRVDPDTRGLEQVGSLASGIDLYGVCLYRNAGTGTFSVFGTAYDGELRQWTLSAVGGEVRAEQVRSVDVGGKIEGCAADDQLGRLYVGEEDWALWRYGAEPDAGDNRVEVAGVGALVPDIEGIAIAAGSGHVVVSSQGSDDYALFGRSGDNPYLGRFVIGDGPIDGTSDGDGVAVRTVELGPAFPNGLLVVQDGDNDGPGPDRQNFKLVPWDAALAAGLGSG